MSALLRGRRCQILDRNRQESCTRYPTLARFPVSLVTTRLFVRLFLVFRHRSWVRAQSPSLDHHSNEKIAKIVAIEKYIFKIYMVGR